MKYFILGPLRDLVKIFASWPLELTKLVVMQPDAIFVTPRPDEVHSTCNCKGTYVHQVPL